MELAPRDVFAATVGGLLQRELGIALRLRTSDFNLLGEEFTVHCEIRAAGETEFRSTFAFETDGYDAPCEHVTGWGLLPLVYRRAFLRLYEHLRATMMLVDFASCSEERYPSEPDSSRDYLFFGAADDLKKIR